MTHFINKFKIPTLLGLAIIFMGIVAGVFLVLKDQNFISQAFPDTTPQNITYTNIEDSSLNISWQTQEPITSFITFGPQNPKEQTALDDQDSQTPKPHTAHYVTIKNLLPKTTYQFKIVSGKKASDILRFETAAPASSQTGFRPIIGSVLDGTTPLDSGIAYLSIAGATTQSSLIKNLGNFLIPISQIRKADLSDVYSLEEGLIAKITVVSDKGEVSALFKLKASSDPLPPLKLGQNVDLTGLDISPKATPSAQELNKFDLNGDGSINANDHAIILQNFGKRPKEKKADLNGDGVVDQKDLDLIQKFINQ